MMKKLATFFLVSFLFVEPVGAIDWSTLDPENVLLMELQSGKVYIAMRPDKAPNHVARIKVLTRQGFYNGLTFHRVIDGFMAQTGDPKGDGTGGSGQHLKAEFSRLRHMRGVVSMARGGDDVNSADSQFFIMYQWNRSLDNNYTIWGRVEEGMEHVDAVRKGNPNDEGRVEFPDSIIRMRVAADVPAVDGGPPAN